MQLAAHGGMNAVAADRGLGVHPGPAAVGSGQVHGHAALVLVDSFAAVPGHQGPLAEPGPDRAREHRLEVTAMDGQLWPVVAGGAADPLGVDALAEPIEVHRLPRCDPHRGQLLAQPEPAQLPDGVRQEVDPDTDCRQLGHGLEHLTPDTGDVQLQGQREAADSGADDGDPRTHATTPCRRALASGIALSPRAVTNEVLSTARAAATATATNSTDVPPNAPCSAPPR